MSELSDSRRNFMRKMLTASVFTAVCPHILLGKSEPEIINNEDVVEGKYHLTLTEYPVLKSMWKGVKVMLKDLGGAYQGIIITRVPFEQFKMDFTAVFANCTHNGGELNLLNPVTHVFKCKKHGSIFDPIGRYQSGPASIDVEHYYTEFKNNEDICISIRWYGSNDCLANSNSDVESLQPLAYMEEINPNPVSTECTINYGIERPSNIEISLFSTSGLEIKKIFNGYQDAGHYKLNFNTLNIPSGIYLCRMIYGKRSITRKLVISK